MVRRRDSCAKVTRIRTAYSAAAARKPLEYFFTGNRLATIGLGIIGLIAAVYILLLPPPSMITHAHLGMVMLGMIIAGKCPATAIPGPGALRDAA